MTRISQLPEGFWLLGSSLFIFILAALSPVTYTSSDPFFSLIVSQSILENRTVKLDDYLESNEDLFQSYFYQVSEINGHQHYNYPLGPSIFSLPVVFVARLGGMDMLVEADNFQLQNLTSAAIVAVIFVLLYFVCRSYLSPESSLAISLVSVLGSALISTLGTALWNLGFSVIFVSASLFLICRFDSEKDRSVHSYLLGLLLAAAYFSRPSAAIFILIVMIYLSLKDRQALIRTASISLILLVIFLVFSRMEFGQWLPSYYSATNWFNPDNFIRAILGLLVSPSRGLIIHSPFLIVLSAGIAFAYRYVKKSLLFKLCFLWLGLQILAVSTTRLWGGGFSFGPRLLTDVLPGVVVMTAIAWQGVTKHSGKRTQHWLAGGYLTLGVVAIFINSGSGLFNVRTPLWNAMPSVDEFPEYLFDWKYPQFLVTADSLQTRLLDHYRKRLAQDSSEIEPYIWGEAMSPGGENNNALFAGWWFAGEGVYWTETESPTLLFFPEYFDADSKYYLEISSSSLGPQSTHITLNESEIGAVTFDSITTTYIIEFNGNQLKAGVANEITLRLPDSANPSLAEIGQLGIRYLPHRLGLTDWSVNNREEEEKGG